MPELMRQTFESLIGQFKRGCPQYALLTSFNFSAGFFERNLLPMLAGYDFTEAETAYSDPEQFNSRLSKVKVLVACDHCTQPEPKGDFRYGLLPVSVENGFFHPKVTLLAGEFKDGTPGALSMVSSGNLTLSGWALNREVVGQVRISAAQATEIDRLLEWLLQQATKLRDARHARGAVEEGEPVPTLTSLRKYISDHCSDFKAAQSPRLLVQLPAEKSKTHPDTQNSLIERLSGGRSFTTGVVVSPFWSSVERMLKDCGFEHVRLVPSLDRSGRYSFPDDPAREHRDFAAFAQDNDRYTHAKAIWAETADGRATLCVGSANFTAAAMGFDDAGRRNVEAMLSFEGNGFRLFDDGSLVAIPRDKLSYAEDADGEEGLIEAPPYEASAAYDWSSGEFSCAVRQSGPNESGHLSIKIGDESLDFGPPASDWRERRWPLELRRPIRACLIRENICHEGPGFRILVAQLNASPDQLGYSKPPRLSDVLNVLLSLGPDSKSREIEARDGRGRGSSLPDDEDQSAVSYDAFSTFQAFYKLRKHYFAKLDFEPFAEDSPLSLVRILRAMEQEAAPVGDHAAMFHRFLLLSELKVTAQQFESTEKTMTITEFQRRLEILTKEIRPVVEEQLRASPAFNRFVGSPENIEQAADVFMDWFGKQLGGASETPEVRQ